MRTTLCAGPMCSHIAAGSLQEPCGTIRSWLGVVAHIRNADVRLESRAGKATVVVGFYRNPDSFVYVNQILVRSSYGSYFISSSGEPCGHRSTPGLIEC